MAATHILQSLTSSLAIKLLLVPISCILVTWVYTTLRFFIHVRKPSNGKTSTPVFIPYSIPWLGHSLSFLAPTPGKFWNDLVTKRISRNRGVCTILLGGQKTHILFSSTAVQALFKTRLTSRHAFNVQVVKAMDMSDEDIQAFYGVEKRVEENAKAEHLGLPRPHSNIPEMTQEHLNDIYVLKQDSANELTSKFTEVFRHQLRNESESWKEVNLYSWLKHHMFVASTTAFMGDKVFEIYPEIEEDFWVFDRGFLSMFFGLPRFMESNGWSARDRMIKGFQRWVSAGLEEYAAAGLPGPDPEDGRTWEPVFGSKALRGRQKCFEQLGMSHKGQACMHLGLLFGLSSNAIPTAGWMLLHCLDPNADPTLLPRLSGEAMSARKSDGTLDVHTLIGLPLLQSIFQETMRLYVDVLVTREALEPFTLPVDSEGSRISLKKKDLVMAPTWLGHRDETVWLGPSPNTWYADRFIRHDEKTGKGQFTMVGTIGKHFPFGGGREICPGRVFAKQEVIAAVAMVISNFDFEVVGFTDENGNLKKTFPGLRKGFVGNGAMPMDGDIRVRIKKKPVA